MGRSKASAPEFPGRSPPARPRGAAAARWPPSAAPRPGAERLDGGSKAPPSSAARSSGLAHVLFGGFLCWWLLCFCVSCCCCFGFLFLFFGFVFLFVCVCVCFSCFPASFRGCGNGASGKSLVIFLAFWAVFRGRTRTVLRLLKGNITGNPFWKRCHFSGGCFPER